MVDLRNIVIGRELWLYSYLPLGVFRNSGKWPDPQFRFSLVLYTHHAEKRIVEWLTYHRSLGFDHVYIYSYDDDPTPLYSKLLPYLQDAKPYVTFYHFPKPANNRNAYFHFLRNHSHETEWLMCLNIDEFLCLKRFASIAKFIDSRFATIDAFYFNRCTYGTNGHNTAPEGDILLNYTRRSPTINVSTKLMVKSQSLPYQKIFYDNDFKIMQDCTYLNAGLKTMNVFGNAMDSWYFVDFPQKAKDFISNDHRGEKALDIGYVAHFAIPSENYSFEETESQDARFQMYPLDQLKYSGMEWSDFKNQANEVEDDFLRNYWRNYILKAWRSSIFPITNWPLISRGKKVTQSSTVQNHTVEKDAKRLTNGRLIGKAQNLTAVEENPWWQIDLGKHYTIHEIQIYNRLDQELDTASNFEICISDNGIEWKTKLQKKDMSVFGGLDGSPFRWNSIEGFTARWLRLVFPGKEKALGLDQVQIFGLPIPENDGQ